MTETGGDRIVIRDLQVFARHGVLPEEAVLGQRFVLDIVAFLDLTAAGRSDDPAETVSYADMIAAASAALTERHRLIEAAATSVVDALFALDARIDRLQVTLRKPGAPVEAVFGDVAVVIDRRRSAPAGTTP